MATAVGEAAGRQFGATVGRAVVERPEDAVTAIRVGVGQAAPDAHRRVGRRPPGEYNAALRPGVDGQLLFNPGSPTQRRMAPTRTIGVLEARRGRLLRAELIDV